MDTVGISGVRKFYCNTDVDDLIRVVKKQHHSDLLFFAPWTGLGNRGDHSKFSIRFPSELELSRNVRGCKAASVCTAPAISAVCHPSAGISNLKAFLHLSHIVYQRP